jgi:hypothetical protein
MFNLATSVVHQMRYVIQRIDAMNIYVGPVIRSMALLSTTLLSSELLPASITQSLLKGLSVMRQDMEQTVTSM